MDAPTRSAKLRPNVQAPRTDRWPVAAIWSIGVAAGATLVAVSLFVTRGQRETVAVSTENRALLGAPIVHWSLDSDGRDEFGHASLDAVPGNDGGGPAFQAGAARFGCTTWEGTGPALRASTSNSYLRLGHDFTISAWVRVDNPGCAGVRTQSDLAMIFHSEQVKLSMNARGNIAASLYDTNGIPSGSLISRGSIRAGVWHHVAVSRRGSAFRIWVDGISTAGTGPSSLAPPNPKAYLYLGRAVVHYGWPGMIDEVTLWDRELTSRELDLLTR